MSHRTLAVSVLIATILAVLGSCRTTPPADRQAAGPAPPPAPPPPESSHGRDRSWTETEAGSGPATLSTLLAPAPHSFPFPLPARVGSPPPLQNRDRFASSESNPVKVTAEEPVSTFSIDVDTASYSFVRNSLLDGVLPRSDAVRVEELVNYFAYDYPPPDSPAPRLLLQFPCCRRLGMPTRGSCILGSKDSS